MKVGPPQTLYYSGFSPMAPTFAEAGLSSDGPGGRPTPGPHCCVERLHHEGQRPPNPAHTRQKQLDLSIGRSLPDFGVCVERLHREGPSPQNPAHKGQSRPPKPGTQKTVTIRRPLKPGTHKTVTARFGPWLMFQVVSSSLGSGEIVVSSCWLGGRWWRGWTRFTLGAWRHSHSLPTTWQLEDS